MYGTDTCLWEMGAEISDVSLFELVIDRHASHRLCLSGLCSALETRQCADLNIYLMMNSSNAV
jgi:hypothetical protein